MQHPHISPCLDARGGMLWTSFRTFLACDGLARIRPHGLHVYVRQSYCQRCDWSGCNIGARRTAVIRWDSLISAVRNRNMRHCRITAICPLTQAGIYRCDHGVASALCRGAPNMNSLIALGASTSFTAGLLSATVPGLTVDSSFLEEPVMLLAFVLLGRSLEARARLKASSKKFI